MRNVDLTIPNIHNKKKIYPLMHLSQKYASVCSNQIRNYYEQVKTQIHMLQCDSSRPLANPWWNISHVINRNDKKCIGLHTLMEHAWRWKNHDNEDFPLFWTFFIQYHGLYSSNYKYIPSAMIPATSNIVTSLIALEKLTIKELCLQICATRKYMWQSQKYKWREYIECEDWTKVWTDVQLIQKFIKRYLNQF